MTLLPAPAHAGHWVWTVSGSGTASTNTGRSQTWTAPTGPVTSPISIPQIVAGDGVGRQFGTGPFPSITATASMTVTITGTWTADTNSDNTAPPSVLFSVQSSANGNCQNNGNPVQAGKADDGLHDPFDPNAQLPGTSDTPKVEYQASQSGSISISLSLSGSASGTPGTSGGGSAGASVGPVTIAVHAQPYNYHKTSQTDNRDGTISFTYDWLSTTGNKSDLTDCYSHERVSYDGATGPKSYFPPSPFSLSTGLDNPTVLPTTDQQNSSMAVTTGSDTHYVWASTGPYSTPKTVTAHQRYEYNDHATGEQNVLIPGPDSTASIDRTISNNVPPYQPNVWVYSVTKQGFTAELQLH